MGRRFSDMDGIQKKAATSGLIAKFTAIAGWRIPDGDDKYQTIFNDQLTKWVHENCGSMTLAELEYAVRKYGVNTSDWGRPMHLGLLSGCIESYMEFRQLVTIEEEQRSKSLYLGQKDAKKQELPAGPIDWSETWDGVVESAKTHAIYKVFIPTVLYDWLIRTGKIDPSVDERKEAFRLAAQQHLSEMQDALLNGAPGRMHGPEVKRRLDVLNRGKQAEIMQDAQLKESITTLAKQQMIRDYAISLINN
ncbi:MAG: hypothetical protein QN716_01635 [Nitrososphaeraceae archaeon]|nr:hypothetical protein [Nitrososphaeraceae archaeon]